MYRCSGKFNYAGPFQPLSNVKRLAQADLTRTLNGWFAAAACFVPKPEPFSVRQLVWSLILMGYYRRTGRHDEPGVGHKIANLLQGLFWHSAIVVDTHCARISTLIGLTKQTSPWR